MPQVSGCLVLSTPVLWAAAATGTRAATTMATSRFIEIL